MKPEKKHFPVLLKEILSIISPLHGGTFIDCTFGEGGYTNAILNNPKNKIIALDRDKKTILNSEFFKKKFKNRFKFENRKFSEIDKVVKKEENIKAIIFDLGYSLTQINDHEKGLSFNAKGKLNMKMGLNEFSAHEAINQLDQKDLESIFKYFGEEKKSKAISRKICKLRKAKILKTEDLVQIINTVKFKKKNIHKATQVFQSLRIFVNSEISELILGLINSFKILPIGGMILIVSLHSIEDRIVKNFLQFFSKNKNPSRYLPAQDKNNPIFKLIKKKPILPSKEEIEMNPPSRSAKLRYAIKTGNLENFDNFVGKFGKLLDVEKLSKKL